MKTLISLRICAQVAEKIDTLAIKRKRSRNYITNELLSKMIKSLEKKYGEIKVNQNALEKQRMKRKHGSRRSKPHPKSGAGEE